MSGIVLSASVRQNLLSLQSTADLLSTTQNRLATGNKVNSALDNPTNFFTAQGLNNRASDINNLLDSIGNGVQVLQAANTGITSIQKLVDTAKSIANQALQTPSQYSTKSQSTATVAGATAANLLGGTTTPATTAQAGTFTGGTFAASTFGTGDTLTFDIAVDGGTATSVTVSQSDVSTALGGNTIGSVADLATVLTAKGISGVTFSGSSGSLVATSATTGATSAVAITNVVADDASTDGTITTSGLDSGTAAAGTDATPASTTGGLSTQQLTIQPTGGGKAIDITFGSGTFSHVDGSGVATNVSTLDQLNTVLAENNMSASIDTTGKITLTTTNDYASETIGTIAGTTSFTAAAGPTADANVQNTRNGLIAQYNQIIDQIKTTAQDASFNGVNLLNGDQLKLVFNETGKSTLNIQGVTFDPAGLGLSKLDTDFKDNASINKVLDSLNNASSTLRSQASAFGSNLSVVQIRQDFNKNLINVLQTGSSNLTLADTNEEAANSQALSTRQSIAVSALALANQSQQSVLQLLR
ncbi:MAG: flagellin [Xanthobacteraceae bacterium]